MNDARKKLTLFCVIVFLFSFAESTFGQRGQDKKLIQFNGIVRDELLKPIPFVHIIIMNKSKGTITDYNGLFSFVVEPHDSVLFSSMGYKRMTVVIPDTLKGTHFPKDIVLEQDTIEISEVRVYPWRTYEEFRQAFIELELPEGDLERARRNLALIQGQIFADGMWDEPNLSYRHAMKEHHFRSSTQGQLPTYSILNPLNWARFIEAIKEGKFRSND